MQRAATTIDAAPPEAAFLIPSGYNIRAVIAFCRALRARNTRPAILACTNEDPIFQTEFGRDVVYVRTERTLQLADFAAAIAATRARTGARRVILAPSSEFLVRWALQHRAEFAEQGCELPLPGEDVYLRVTDKLSFTEHCGSLGLPVPQAMETPRVPCVAKPKHNVSRRGGSLYPWLLRTEAELAHFVRDEDPTNFFFQEWVSGRSFYLFYYLPAPGRGAAVVFSQENLCQQPGGKSVVLARSARLHETAEAAKWERALRAAGFHGLVMVELRHNGREFVLIEANPRLWGPLQLCVDGCPELVERYAADHGAVRSGVTSRAARAARYSWLGGYSAAADWHPRRPRLPLLSLLVAATTDVLLRRDSWRLFLAEFRNRARRTAPAAIVPPLLAATKTEPQGSGV